jgi:hypothetical protein
MSPCTREQILIKRELKHSSQAGLRDAAHKLISSNICFAFMFTNNQSKNMNHAWNNENDSDL